MFPIIPILSFLFISIFKFSKIILLKSYLKEIFLKIILELKSILLLLLYLLFSSILTCELNRSFLIVSKAEILFLNIEMHK